MPLYASGARRFYDRVGRLQEAECLYERTATRRLAVLGAFDQAAAVFELGCGTGRLAEHLFTRVLPPEATYLAVDVSPRMVEIATRRLAGWSDRADVRLVDPPALTLPGADHGFDRFLATYVFDLLSGADAAALLGEAARLVMGHGLLALASLTAGTTRVSRAVSCAWGAVAERWPERVGGCRPIELRDLVSGQAWHIEHREVVVRFGVPTELLVARRTDSSVRSCGRSDARRVGTNRTHKFLEGAYGSALSSSARRRANKIRTTT